MKRVRCIRVKDMDCINIKRLDIIYIHRSQGENALDIWFLDSDT